MPGIDDRLTPCGRLIRQYDSDRYLTALFASPDRREALFALAAFNLEIAKTREVVTEPLLGQIRLQWWRDALDEMFRGEVRRHEVMMPLAKAVERHRLDRRQFERLLVVREFDLEDRPPADFAALEAYAVETSVPLVLLAYAVLATEPSSDGEGFANALGTATALTGIARAVPFHARQRRLYLPADLMAEADVAGADVFALRPHDGLARVVASVCEAAGRHLETARQIAGSLQRSATPLRLQAALTAGHLKVLRRAGYNVFAPAVQRTRPLRIAGLLWRALLGRS
ncbi:MAG: squalene/phytoene synthase family protein [Inquilinus sp.]|nr:squalene/phytoene synthase family protein [Inquilinus sp.]